MEEEIKDEEVIFIKSGNGLSWHLEEFRKNKNHIEYFKKYFLENLRSDPKKVRDVYDKVISIAKEQKYNTAYAWCLLYKGWDYNLSCNFTDACQCTLEANEIFIRENDVVGQIESCNALLVNYLRIGVIDLAIDSGLHGIELAEQNDNEKDLFNLMINTAIAHIECKKFDEARKLLDRIKKFDTILNDTAIICYNITLAEVEVNCKNIQKSYECCEKAYRLIEKANCWIYECEVLSIRAQVKAIDGIGLDAENDFKAAIENAKKYENSLLVIKTLHRWAKYCGSINRIDLMEEKLLMALDELKFTNSPLDESSVFYELSELYFRKNYSDMAYYYLKKHMLLEKELFNNQSSSWFAQIHSKEVEREAKIYKELYQDMDLISQIGKKITSDLKLENNLNVIYEEVKKLMKVEIFGIALADESRTCLNYDLFIVDGKRKDYGSINLNAENFGAWCFKNKDNIIINDFINEYEKYIPTRQEVSVNNKKDVNSLIFCPLIVENKCIGILTIQTYEKNSYDKNDIKKLEILTSYIAIALENAKLFNSINYAAKYDALTELYNRREIIKRGEEVLNNSDKCTVIIMDIDNFKLINDTYGHGGGDYVLKTVSNIMKEKINENSFVGRYGGEEFLMILSNQSHEEVVKYSENLRGNIEKYLFEYRNRAIKVSASMGVYSFKDNMLESFEHGIRCADKALYLAKDMGKNKVILYK